MGIEVQHGDDPVKTARAGRWFLVLFGVPFAAVGVGVIGWLVLPMLSEWQAMKSWSPVQAELLAAELTSSSSDDSTTYRATARYRYEYNGTTYENDKVAIGTGSDNIGHFQQDLGAQLEAAYAQHAPITVYVDPDDPAKAVANRELRWGLLVLMSIFGLIFGVVGIAVMTAGLFAKDTATGLVDAAQPWRERREWATPEIRSGGKGGALAAWLFAFIWCGISGMGTVAVLQDTAWAGSVATLFAGAAANPAVYIILLFDAVGLALLAWALRTTLSARRFGALVLHMDPHPGAIGGDVGGTIDLPVPFDAARAIELTLSCVHVYTRRSGNDNETQRDPVFSDTRFFLGEQTANGTTRVHFCFPVPEGLPVSSAPPSARHEWAIDLACALPGIDLARRFEIPVFTATGAAAKSRVATRAREATGAALARLETLMNLVQVPGGIAMDFHAGRAWKGALGLLLFGAIFAAVPVFLSKVADAGMFTTVLFGGVFGLVGLAAIVGAVWMAGNGLRVQIDDDGLWVRRYLFGLPVHERRQPRDVLAGIVATRGGSMTSGSQVTVFYDLAVRLADGTDIGVGDGFRGYGEAQRAGETIAGFTRLPFLGERSKPSLMARKAAREAGREQRKP